MPPGTVIPEVAYPDVASAAAWLCAAFGFEERLRIGNHRVQLTIGDGSLVVVESATSAPPSGCSVMIRVNAIDQHYQRAREHGAQVVREPETHVFGERQYTAVDFHGHVWTFSESVADVDPSEWGGTLR
jgi:uncharacterized glyoxalase superfamily protein PhnB